MTLAQLQSRGFARISLRLVIEGWPHMFTTDPRIEDAYGDALDLAGDGRGIYSGLVHDGLNIRERAVLRDGWSEMNGMTFKIRSTRHAEEAMASFTRAPAPVGYLSPASPLTAAATSITLDTGATLANGYYHIATECFSVATGVLTRGRWDTTAQVHSTQREGGAVIPTPVYQYPPTMEGRRVWLYLYTDQDARAAEGSLVWRGVVARPPRMDSDGITWIIQVDPLQKVLEQNVAAKETEYRIRGWYFHDGCPFIVRMATMTSGGSDPQPTDYKLTGFYETQQDLIDDVNTYLDGVDDATVWTAFEYGIADGLPYLEGTRSTSATNEIWVTRWVGSVNGGVWMVQNSQMHNASINGVPADEASLSATDAARFFQPWNLMPTAPAAATIYRLDPDADDIFFAEDYEGAAMPFPSTILGYVPPPTFVKKAYRDSFVDADDDTYTATRIYLDRDPGDLSANDGLMIVAGDRKQHVKITYVDTTDDYILVTPAAGNALEPMFLDGSSKLIPTRLYEADGDLSDFLDGLITAAPEANDGDTPFIVAGDASDTDWRAAIAQADPAAFMKDRAYIFYKSVSVKTIMQEELKALGMFLCTDSTGKLAITRLPRVSLNETAVATIDDEDLLLKAGGTGGMMPLWEAQGDGLVSHIKIRLGYDPFEDDFNESLDFEVRDLRSIAEHKTRGKGKIEIAPRSIAGTLPNGKSRKIDLGTLYVDEFESLFAPYLDVMSRDYATVTIAVPWLFSDVLLGDVIDFASAYVPDGDGARGIDTKAFVVGRELNLDPSRPEQMRLTLYIPRSPVAGYTPSALVASQVNTSGNTWTLTINPASTFNIVWSEAADGDVVRHFSASQKVRIVQLGTTTATEVAGTVVSTSGTTTIVVTFDGVWTPGASTWALMWAKDTGSLLAAQNNWAYAADSTRLLYGGTYARRFG